MDVIVSNIVIAIKLVGAVILTIFATIFALIMMFIPSFRFTDNAAIKELKQNVGVEITKKDTSIKAYEDFLGFDPYAKIEVTFKKEYVFQNLIKQIESGVFMKNNAPVTSDEKDKAVGMLKLNGAKGVWFKTDDGYNFTSILTYKENNNNERKSIDLDGMETCGISAEVKKEKRRLIYEYYCI